MDAISKKPEKTRAERIKALEEKQQALTRRLREELAKESNAKRKIETKRKIIVGSWVLANEADLALKIKASLTRKQDLEAFEGWAPTKSEPVGAA